MNGGLRNSLQADTIYNNYRKVFGEVMQYGGCQSKCFDFNEMQYFAFHVLNKPSTFLAVRFTYVLVIRHFEETRSFVLTRDSSVLTFLSNSILFGPTSNFQEIFSDICTSKDAIKIIFLTASGVSP